MASACTITEITLPQCSVCRKVAQLFHPILLDLAGGVSTTNDPRWGNSLLAMRGGNADLHRCSDRPTNEYGEKVLPTHLPYDA